MALLRHGAMRRLFTGVRAPSTLGTFLCAFTFGHVRQLDAVASRLLVNLAREAPLLPGAAELAFLDVDDTMRQTDGYAKQGAGRGYTGVKGLNALLAVVSTPSSAPVIVGADGHRREQPTRPGVTHPSSNRARPETPWRSTGPPGHLDLPAPHQQQEHATSMIIEGPTVDPG